MRPGNDADYLDSRGRCVIATRRSRTHRARVEKFAPEPPSSPSRYTDARWLHPKKDELFREAVALEQGAMSLGKEKQYVC
jgi:hypothetical protein